MAHTTLPQLKAHLRIEPDDTDQDVPLAMYLDAAEEWAILWCGKTFGASLPASVTAAVLLQASDLYENRAAQTDTALQVNATVRHLLQPHRSYLGAFGGGMPLIAPVGLEADTLIAGDTWARTWPWQDATGAPISLAQHSVLLELLDGSTVVRIAAAVVGEPASAGLASVTLSPEVTAAMPRSPDLWYRVRAIHSVSGSVTSFARRRLAITD